MGTSVRSAVAPGHFRHRMAAYWRLWLLVFTLVAFLSVFSTGLTHHHKTAAEALDCPVCHVVGHQALDAHTPDLTPVASAVLWLLLSLSLFSIGRIECSPSRRPSSRAPPLRFL